MRGRGITSSPPGLILTVLTELLHLSTRDDHMHVSVVLPKFQGHISHDTLLVSVLAVIYLLSPSSFKPFPPMLQLQCSSL